MKVNLGATLGSLRLFLSLALLGATIGCTDDGGTGLRGTVQGTVLLEGAPVAGAAVDVSGPTSRTTTTDGQGRYAFGDLPSGAYVVTLSGAPLDASFPATSRTAVITRSESVQVDFTGNFIRTASITGRVTSRNEGLAGVRVTLSGVDSLTTLTAVDGKFTFPGLRAGRYEVTISEFSPSITFPSTRTELDLAIGESLPVTFDGIPQLTATVVIRSLTRPLPGGQVEPVDPQNVRGSINVTLTVDRGEDTVERVELLLGGQVVAQQSFNDLVGVGEGQPDAAAPFDLVFLVNTAEFDESTGTTRFRNGSRTLTARLATREGGEAAWTSSFPLVLRNPDTFVARLSAEKGPVAGANGEDWVGGAITVDVVPVIYTAGAAVSTVVLELRRFAGPMLRERSAAGTGVIRFIFPATGPAGTDNVVGYRTPDGSFDQFRVRAATFTDGTTVAGLPVTVITPVRIDAVSAVPGN